MNFGQNKPGGSDGTGIIQDGTQLLTLAPTKLLGAGRGIRSQIVVFTLMLKLLSRRRMQKHLLSLHFWCKRVRNQW